MDVEEDQRNVSHNSGEDDLKMSSTCPSSAGARPSPLRLPVQALRAVVKIFVVKAEPNYAQPWQVRPQKSTHGSGFIISDLSGNKRILTNSHVIVNSNTVHIRRPGLPKKFPAEVLCIGHACDLALLHVSDEKFWEGLAELSFDDIPHLQDSVVAVGYPRGGDSLSVSKGVVSRIDMKRYSSEVGKLLCVQIDAAINPGNSGGPAFNDGTPKVVGVAFCKISDADNIGYIIPYCIVRHFLIEFDKYKRFRGVSGLGFQWQEMENEAHRKFLKLTDEQSGVRVVKLDPLSLSSKHLQVGDVIMSVNGTSIADDGTIRFRGEERINFSHIVRMKPVDEEIHYQVLRNGQTIDVEFALNITRFLVPTTHLVDCLPSYYIVGGVVFLPLSIPFLEHAYGNHWRRGSPIALQIFLKDYREDEDTQIVILFQILSAELNYGYARCSMLRVDECGGVAVKNLRHLIDLVEKSDDEWIRFGLDGGHSVVLSRKRACGVEGRQILKQHSISSDKSVDMETG